MEYEIRSADENVCGADETVRGVDMLGEAVVSRFFQAMEEVAEDTNTATVLRNCNIDSHNYYKKRRGDRGMCKIPVAWLSSLCARYRVSPEWILLGKGNMLR
jgi:hypothetical protein